MNTEKITRNAEILATRYARRCNWTSYEDLKQEALAAQLESLRTYDPDKPNAAPPSAYAYISARYAVQRMVLSTSAPVSSRHDPKKLLGVRTYGLSRPSANDAHDATECEYEEVCASNAYGVEYTHREHWSSRVRERLVELLGADAAEFALLLLSHEFLPGEVAEEHSIPAAYVYRAVGKLRRRCADDAVLRALWKDAT